VTVHDRKEFEMLSQRSDQPGLEDTKMTLVGRMQAEARLQERIRLLSQQIEARFGPLSESRHKKLEELAADDQADDLAIRLLGADSLDALGLA
jgi:hypothetical protein